VLAYAVPSVVGYDAREGLVANHYTLYFQKGAAMQNTIACIGFMAIALVSLTGNLWASIECCCKPLTCTFKPWFPAVPSNEVPINECYYFSDERSWMCDERLICISEIDAENPLWYFTYKPGEIIVDGVCDIDISDDCLSETLLGPGHPGLEALGRFRDEVLSKSQKGRRLTKAYYKYGSELIDVLKENPGLEAFVTALLEKIIERLQESVASEEELLTDELADAIEVVTGELDLLVENQDLKKLLKQLKQDVTRIRLMK
jgi:hypothetical protein